MASVAAAAKGGRKEEEKKEGVGGGGRGGGVGEGVGGVDDEVTGRIRRGGSGASVGSE